MEFNWENFLIAKELIGEKVLLLGGGQITNAFMIVKVLSVNEETGQVKVKTGKSEMNLLMRSWYIRPLKRDLMDLELGDYLLSFDGEIRKQDGGLFGTIYDCTLVKKIGDRDEI